MPERGVPRAAQNNTLGMMAMANCSGLTVRNAFAYYQTPPFTQATLVDVTPDHLTWTIQARAVPQCASPEVLSPSVRPQLVTAPRLSWNGRRPCCANLRAGTLAERSLRLSAFDRDPR